MKILAGLGNPGSEYAQSRHNAGWHLVDHLLAEHASGWKHSVRKDWNAEVWHQPNVLLLKPLTYMNGSGQAIQAAVQFYKVGLEDLYVAHDDLDLELGSYKLKRSSGPKVHNGLLSTYQHLGSEDFWHVRLGVDSRQGDRSMPGSAYVLQGFSAGDKPLFQQMIRELSQELWPLLTVHD